MVDPALQNFYHDAVSMSLASVYILYMLNCLAASLQVPDVKSRQAASANQKPGIVQIQQACKSSLEGGGGGGGRYHYAKMFG